MKLIVDAQQRYAKMRAHTATHLLHAELEKIFPMTKQAGSLVNEDYTRFDFAAERALSDDEVREIELTINTLIQNSLTVTTQELSYDEAIKLGAKAFFEEKYADIVRVVTIQKNTSEAIASEKSISIELCGGTHVSNTSEIGAFKITGQEAVAAGTKRIVAVTGPAVATYAQQQDDKLSNFAAMLDVPLAQLDKKLHKIIKENQELQDTIQSLQTKLLSTELEKLSGKSIAPFDQLIDIPETLLGLGFKTIVAEAKTLFADQNILLRSAHGQFAAVAGNDALDAKERAASHNLRGGGSNNLFQGKDDTILTVV